MSDAKADAECHDPTAALQSMAAEMSTIQKKIFEMKAEVDADSVESILKFTQETKKLQSRHQFIKTTIMSVAAITIAAEKHLAGNE